MQSGKAFIVVVSILLLSVLYQPVFALTFDYLTTAEALAEVGWNDYLGPVAAYDYDTKEANNARSYATAYYDEIQFMGNVGISALADAFVEPNEVILSAEVTGSYEFDIGWDLMEYFYQDANGTVAGLLRVGEFPTGAPCLLQIDISFPNDTWNGLWAWQLYIESSSDYFDAGRDELGDYGERSGTIDAYAGEEIYVFLGFAARGYADHDIEALGDGKLTINATLKAIRKVMTKAYNPSPADGTLYNDTWVSLGWSPGNTAVSHDVYFGISFDDVKDRTNETFQGSQATTYFIAGSPGSPCPDGLVPGTTYYWRIDEINEADPNSPWKGDVWSFTIPPKTAYNPDPADGAEFVDPNTTLSWMAGLDAKLHTVYLSDNFDDVNDAAGGSSQGPTIYNPGTLELEKVYYWRVDEFDGDATYKGDVWSFTTPGAVGNPQPANGAIDVQMNSTLNWTPAITAVSHDVYFGIDKDAVRNATTDSPEYKGNKALGAESYDPGKLTWYSDYYWRVDAIYNTGTVKGLVWSFTTADFITVDDFESYNNIDPPDPLSYTIFAGWLDGYGTTDNGALIGNDPPLPYAEQNIVHGGNQAMPYSYDANLKYAEATHTLTYPRDWTERGAEKLSLWFRGDWINVAVPMYVAIANTTGTPAVVNHDDPEATRLDVWTEWIIPLQAFEGIDLTDINTISIGFGNKTNPEAGGSGKMFFDDIRLYRPREAAE